MQGSQIIRGALPGLAMMAVGAAFFAASFEIEILEQGGTGPRVFPMAGSLLIAGLGFLQLVHGRRASSEVQPAVSKPLSVLALAILSVAYVACVSQFGYLIATAVAAPAALYLFGIRSVTGLILSALLCPAIYHLVFFEGLGVFPPYGLQFDLLDVIQGY